MCFKKAASDYTAAKVAEEFQFPSAKINLPRPMAEGGALCYTLWYESYNEIIRCRALLGMSKNSGN